MAVNSAVPGGYSAAALVVLVASVLTACSAEEPAALPQAAALAQRHLIVDTHIDAPYRLYRQPANLAEAAVDREFDYPRARDGGLNVAFMSIYTPASAAEAGEARLLADRLIDSMEQLVAEHPDKFAIAACTDDVAQLRQAGVVALALGMENGSPLFAPPTTPTPTTPTPTTPTPTTRTASADETTETEAVDHFVARGIRYVTLAHSKSNEYADSSYDANQRWQGLSEAGRTLVATLNRRGVMIDISHLSDKAAWQVIELSAAPIIASHSSLRHFIPGFERNMSDAMLQALAKQGGVLQVNFGSGFVSGAARAASDAFSAALAARFADQTPNAEVRRTFMNTYQAAHPYPYATTDTVLDHIDRAVQLAGIDHVGIGSDFDGVGDTLPTGLKDVGDYPNLVAGLLQRGYGEADIAKILGLNLMRVWRMVEERAAEHGQQRACNHT